MGRDLMIQHHKDSDGSTYAPDFRLDSQLHDLFIDERNQWNEIL